MRLVEPSWHEVSANFLYDEHGLAPFFAADRRVKQGGGSQTAEFRDDGERWVVRLYYQNSGIVHPGPRTPTGTEFRLDEMREYRLAVSRHAEEDPTGQQSFNAHLAPRWSGMEVENARGQHRTLDVPIQEGINVKVSGSNIDIFRYEELLRQAAEAVGINGRYFEEPHEYSNVQDAERYVRIHCDASGPVHARDGPIAKMGHLLEHDRTGYRKVVQNDDDSHGRNLPGYYHTVTLGPRRVREAFPSHRFPVEVKHYYAREARSKSKDDSLRHPKVGVSYQVSRWDGKIGVTDEDLEELRRQLDRTLHSVLIDAGLNPTPSSDGADATYVPDPYFPADVDEDAEEPPSLDLSHIRHEQESIVVRALTDGLSPVEWESLKTLVSDGGTVSPKDIAARHGRHEESVRRALRRMSEMVEREYGSVSLKSTYVAELVYDAVQEAEASRESFKRAAETAGKALASAKRGLDERTSALLAWCARYDVEVDSRGDAVQRIRLGELDRDSDADPAMLVKRAYELWTDARQDVAAFRSAVVEYRRPEDRGVRTVEAWRLLRR
ncbi:MarR family transcriptional regulator [Halogeometricum sp. S1BR25-6]|uniref:MarR family transcriptional regulator n=1 Tax=Halogeometricum salsisoli TaxID=2950536 RepID=A0ABU2GAE9_9EURY|nr:MarR family transcriptional regulator [Halogeometricum sp. S1BR25-6]MDS0297770.1 MarR family transcriptional regulator [Halogeometricum sp. S1BR25-6]